MKIALYGKTNLNDSYPLIQQLVNKLEQNGCRLLVYEPFHSATKEHITYNNEAIVFSDHKTIDEQADLLFSFGGDGTLLDTITLVRDSGVPVLGINLGRLGFLSSISKDDILNHLDGLLNGKYKIDQRTLLRLETDNNLFGDLNYALNDATIYKRDPFSMLTIQAYVNNKFLNTYWADGLIVSTPTGSTAYSLSSGGPIIVPGSDNFVITPIATHNLTVRPIVIPDNSEMRIKVIGRNREFFVSLDSRSKPIDSSVEMILKKEVFKINLLRLENEDFFTTIREKLMWGLDIRN